MFSFSPITLKRFKKFKKIRRSWVSLWIFGLLIFVSASAELIANNKPLLIAYQGKYYFPVFQVYRGTDFGKKSKLPPNYKRLVKSFNPPDFAIFPPIRWGSNESNREVLLYPSQPTFENLLGTDTSGRDVLTRMLYGIRVSMSFAFINCFFAVMIGILIGGIQGFFGGKIDIIGQRVVEVWGTMPYFFVLILLGSLFEPGFLVLTLMSGVFSWIGLSYYFRAECLKVKQGEFILAATALGSGKLRNFFTHVIPNSLTPVITFTPFIIAGGVLLLTSLDFLGYGVQPPTASLGELLRMGQQNFENAWWLVVFPFALLVISLLLLNFIGEGVRNAFDPRKG
ncbi:MAG: ABC transporter permease subunit [SAR324 cluster bacterium]|nr:ABC transporter permease subunit [SAR324 cluster bacterium]